MATVTLTPAKFTMVLFEPDRIKEIVTEVAGKIGVDADIAIEVDEASALGRARVRSVDPVELWLQGGALEDPKSPRHLSERNAAEVFGRLLFRVRDRLDPAFGEPPADDDLNLQQSTAWDAYCLGRLQRAGYEVSKPRRQYHFRNRHGFTDVADGVFERLWTADKLTWADLEKAVAETEAARAAV